MSSYVAMELIHRLYASLGIINPETGAVDFEVTKVLLQKVPGWEDLEEVMLII